METRLLALRLINTIHHITFNTFTDLMVFSVLRIEKPPKLQDLVSVQRSNFNEQLQG